MRYLIVKTSSLGDIVQSFDALCYLREKFPKAQVDWVVEKPYEDLVLYHPFVNRVLTINTKRWKKLQDLQSFWVFRRDIKKHSYEAIFDLQGNCKSAWILWQAKSLHKVGFGKKSVREWPGIFFTHHKYNFAPSLNIRCKYLHLLQAYFEDNSPFTKEPFLYAISKEQKKQLEEICFPANQQKRNKVMVCPGAKWKNKQLTPLAWKKLLETIKQECDPFFFFMWGSLQERQLANHLQSFFAKQSQVVDRLSIPAWQRLMEQMDLVLALDSSALHLCATTSTPSLSLFGPTESAIFKPPGNRHIALQGPCPYEKKFIKQCPLLRTCKTGACMQKISLEEIHQQFTSWWQSLSKSI